MRSLLVTGGTGSFGKAFIREVLRSRPEVERVVVYSRDELKQYEMSSDEAFTSPKMRFFIGDVRDKTRLAQAFEGVDTIVHAAALKQVPAAEYNPFEAIKTNVIGAQNVIECALERGVERVVALSTDKASSPVNLYGATKLCSDKLFVAANNLRGRRKIWFSVVRYGNVMGSRGSVIPLFLKKAPTGKLPITDERMTRFNITLSEGVRFVLRSLDHNSGGELVVPKLPSFRVTDLAEAIGPGCERQLLGIRPGEKLHEEMVSTADAPNTLEFPTHYVVLPIGGVSGNPTLEHYQERYGGERCAPEFHYSSANNTQWLSVAELRGLIREHLDPSFQPYE